MTFIETRGSLDATARLSAAGVSVADQLELLNAVGQDERNTLLVAALMAEPRAGDTFTWRGRTIRITCVVPARIGHYAIVGEPVEGVADERLG